MSKRKKRKPSNSAGFKLPKKICPLNQSGIRDINYKDTELLKHFITEKGKIIPQRISGVSFTQQKNLKRAIKRARNVALLSFVGNYFMPEPKQQPGRPTTASTRPKGQAGLKNAGSPANATAPVAPPKLAIAPEAKTEVKPEVKTEVKPEVKAEVKPEVKAEVKPEVKAEVNTTEKPTVAPEINATTTDKETTVKAEVKPEVNTTEKPTVAPEIDATTTDKETTT